MDFGLIRIEVLWWVYLIFLFISAEADDANQDLWYWAYVLSYSKFELH